MYTIDTIEIAGPVAACFHAAADVERWPERLPHYRWVRFQRRDGFGTGRVEMAATRRFGPIPYPVWWVSEMSVDEARPAVIYRHVDGITTAMDVEWTFEDLGERGTRVEILHAWDSGPDWPIPRVAARSIADRVIGPVFIHHVASRTLRGIKRHVEGGTRLPERDGR